MKKNLIMFVLIFFVSSFLTGCNSIPKSDYQIWRDSADSEDLNGDRKINELDYQLFLEPPLSDYEVWRNSEDSEDLNGDRKINETDYALFLNPPPSDYEVWSESTDAEDLNGDTIINETDYELFLNPPPSAYEVWKGSDDALDLNGDRRINETDYELFLNPPPSEYELWLDSENAQDLNDDTIIDDQDYDIYLEFVQYVGNYHITNYYYEGIPATLFNSNLDFDNVSNYINQVVFIINEDRSVYITLPQEVITLLGSYYSLALELIDSMQFSTLSATLLALDASVTFENALVNVTIYFNKITNGFSLSYSAYDVVYHQILGTVNFDVIKD